MDDDEAMLLAELRAISQKSSTSRFQGTVEDNHDEESRSPSSHSTSHNSPTHQGGGGDRTDERLLHQTTRSDVSSSSPSSTTTTRLEQVPDHDKEDEVPDLDELLCDDEDEEEYGEDAAVDHDARDEDDDEDVFHDALKSPEKMVPLMGQKTMTTTSTTTVATSPFKQKSTFQGERGGLAEDAELLALLRGVSAQSKSADRFRDDDNDDDNHDTTPTATPSWPSRSTMTAASKDDKPWRKGGRTEGDSKRDSQTIVTSIPSPPMAVHKVANSPVVETVPTAPLAPQGNNFFNQPSTFTGERGGSAEDAELLALLRGVSANSSSSDRFANDNDAVESLTPAVAPAPAPMAPPRAPTAPKREQLPPWKRGQAKATTPEAPSTSDPVPQVTTSSTISSSSSTSGRGNFKQESTFSGERGGAAEDEELLALLRGVSSRSSGSHRFSHHEETAAAAADPPVVSGPTSVTEVDSSIGNFKQQPSTFQGERGGAAEDEELLALLKGISQKAGGVDRFAHEGDGMAAPLPPQGGDKDDILVTRDNLPEYLTHSNWKVRRDSYILLRTMIVETSGGHKPSGSISANVVFPSMDSHIAAWLMDKNATALEEALDLVTVYADYCVGGQSVELAETITINLIKGGAFTSTRPKAIKGSQALTLKLMQVGNDTASIKAIVGVLLDKGLTSKMPKIVQMSTSLLLDAAQSFGAACLPLAAIQQSLPKMLTHSNKKIRDTALEVVAELCRALGGKAALGAMIHEMKKQQLNDLDALLQKQPLPSEIKMGLRSRQHSGGRSPPSAQEALAALQAGSAELEAERFAKRPAVNLPEEVSKSEYAEHLKLTKWSEKVAGLDMILACAGEKPYKLVHPSSTVNYAPLIGEMKGLLPHTHFAVVTKALDVLAMMAEGVGDKLYPHLRPLLPKLFALSKDKKLTKPVASCLDAFFGNVLSFDHILDADSAIPKATSEQTERNALARTMTLEFLGRCVAREATAGPRGALTMPTAKLAAQVASDKLGDSDASVRAAALDVLKELQKINTPLDIKRAILSVIDGLETTHPRVYKQLGGSNNKNNKNNTSLPPATVGIPAGPSATASQEGTRTTASIPTPTGTRSTTTKSLTQSSLVAGGSTTVRTETTESDPTSIDEATEYVASLCIPLWDAADDDGGVLAGLLSTKWLLRQNSIKSMASFISQRELDADSVTLQKDTLCFVVLVKEHTRGFNETNVQVSKSIMELFLVICDRHEKAQCPIPTWIARDMASISCSKIADKKLSPISKSLLMSACVVATPLMILGQTYDSISNVKSPLAQEEFLHWMKSFAETFGAASLGSGMRDAVAFLSKQCESTNLKVKKAAHAVMAVFHRHLGGPFQSLVLASTKDPTLRGQFEAIFSSHPHDPTATNAQWARQSLATAKRSLDDKNPSSTGGGVGFEVPTFNLMAELPADCIARMGSNDGKTAWKARKAAMEDLEEVLKRCMGLLDTTSLKFLVDLLRSLRDRLSDSQSNLKPVAARLIGVIMSATDATSQAKLGKVVYGPLINSAMNDSRAVMHDACMEALKRGTSLPTAEGGGPNVQALEPFLIGLVGELDESDFKNAGIADVFELTKSFADLLPNLDGIASQGGNTLGGRLAKVLVNGLSSSKVDLRSSSESLMEACVRTGSLNMATIKKLVARQKPAVQRTLAPIIQKLSVSSTLKTPVLNIEPREDLIEADFTLKEPIIERASKRTLQTRPLPVAATNHATSRQESAIKAQPRSPHRGTANLNPLVANGGAGIQKSKAALKSMTWPVYPEEPSGDLILGALKNAWTPLIPLESAKVLFPEGGIKKQDDAMAGIELLSRAIAMDRAEDGLAIMEQIGLIWKWITFVLCCKDSTVGTQALLQLTSDLVDHLSIMNYEIVDSEVMVFVPHLFEKASAAKGRFKDTFLALIEQIKAEDFLVTKLLGPIVCIGIIEGSSYPKARLLACKECQLCVEKVGLTGVGKRGVLVVAKSLSEETLQENKNSLVELIVALVLRMNGDIQRFTRICGPSLSGKARSLVEERLKKGGGVASAVAKSRPSVAGPSTYTSSNLTRGSKATPSNLPTIRSKQSPKPSPVARPSVDIDDEIKDELPALDLRLGMRPTPISSAAAARSQTLNQSLYSEPQPDLLGAEDVGKRSADDFGNTIPSPTEEERESLRSTLFTASSNDSESSLGAAASLRARLMKIRERNKGGPVPSGENSPNRSDAAEGAMVDSPAMSEGHEARPSTFEDTASSGPHTGVAHLDSFLDAIRRLLARDVPLSEEDSEIIECTDVLKSIHAAVSQQPGLAVNMDVNGVSRLRVEIKDNANEVVETLTRLISFGFDCHDQDCNGGMSIPLLSVNLASLMAIFRSEDVAKSIRVEHLTVLIKEAGKALLDPRLGSVSPTNALDESTSTQMVRAINKLAVQAATGSTRHFAFEALMTMQQQLCLKADPSDEPLFNSRLSRVVSKLFARVVKAEESTQSPFVPPSVDLESIICVLEDTLSACDEAEGTIAGDAIAATKNLAVVLVTAVIKAQGETTTLQTQMEELGISADSSLGRLAAHVADQMGIASPQSMNISRQPSSVEVAALVSAVGEASVGAARDAAVSALKAYKAEHGDDELNNHLNHVSAAFRSFILEHLSAGVEPGEAEKPTPSSMSERIKSLRSKLNATEVVVHSGVERTRIGSPEATAVAKTDPGEDPATESNTIARSASASNGVQAFRQRLAAARSTPVVIEPKEAPGTTATAGSRAAALRARLQAVKRQTEL